MRTLIFGVDVPGYASVIVAVLILGSIQLLTLGLFGAYLGRVFEEVKRRPLYLLKQKPKRRSRRQRREDAEGLLRSAGRRVESIENTVTVAPVEREPVSRR